MDIFSASNIFRSKMDSISTKLRLISQHSPQGFRIERITVVPEFASLLVLCGRID